MRILLVENYALDNQASMLRYADLLRREMRARGHTVEVVQPAVVVGGWAKQPAIRKWLGYIDKYLLFPRGLLAQARGFDLVHVWIARHLARARNVVCVSEHTALDLRALGGGATQNIVVIPNALDPTCAPAAEDGVQRMRERMGLAQGERYLLHVGGNVWYKNRLAVLRIFGIVRERRGDDGLRLVIAGTSLSPELREFADANLPKGSVIDVAGPADEELWAIYTGAAALLFPSWQEGFGWPLIEAQRCGCPVITSDRAPMNEVAGAAALYIDPEDEAAAADLIAARLDGLDEMREGGLRNAERFNAGAIATKLEAFFTGVAAATCEHRDRRHKERGQEC
jgi:glycosyltransferase involved in cell wall biosynthesis